MRGTKYGLAASMAAISIATTGCQNWHFTQPPVERVDNAQAANAVSVTQNGAAELILLPAIPANHEDAPQAPLNYRIKRDAQGNLLIAQLSRSVQNPDRLQEAARVRDFLNDPEVRPSDVGTIWTHVVFDLVWVPRSDYGLVLQSEIERWTNKSQNAQFAPRSNFFDMYLGRNPMAWGENTNPPRSQLRYGQTVGVDPADAPKLIELKLQELRAAQQEVYSKPNVYGAQSLPAKIVPANAPQSPMLPQQNVVPPGLPKTLPVGFNSEQAQPSAIAFSPAYIYWMRVRAMQERARSVC